MSDRNNKSNIDVFAIKKPENIQQATIVSYFFMLRKLNCFIIFLLFMLACLLTNITKFAWIGVLLCGISFYIIMRREAIKEGLWLGFK